MGDIEYGPPKGFKYGGGGGAGSVASAPQQTAPMGGFDVQRSKQSFPAMRAITRQEQRMPMPPHQQQQQQYQQQYRQQQHDPSQMPSGTLSAREREMFMVMQQQKEQLEAQERQMMQSAGGGGGGGGASSVAMESVPSAPASFLLQKFLQSQKQQPVEQPPPAPAPVAAPTIAPAQTSKSTMDAAEQAHTSQTVAKLEGMMKRQQETLKSMKGLNDHLSMRVRDLQSKVSDMTDVENFAYGTVLVPQCALYKKPSEKSKVVHTWKQGACVRVSLPMVEVDYKVWMKASYVQPKECTFVHGWIVAYDFRAKKNTSSRKISNFRTHASTTTEADAPRTRPVHIPEHSMMPPAFTAPKQAAVTPPSRQKIHAPAPRRAAEAHLVAPPPPSARRKLFIGEGTNTDQKFFQSLVTADAALSNNNNNSKKNSRSPKKRMATQTASPTVPSHESHESDGEMSDRAASAPAPAPKSKSKSKWAAAYDDPEMDNSIGVNDDGDVDDDDGDEDDDDDGESDYSNSAYMETFDGVDDDDDDDDTDDDDVDEDDAGLAAAA